MVNLRKCTFQDSFYAIFSNTLINSTNVQQKYNHFVIYIFFPPKLSVNKSYEPWLASDTWVQQKIKYCTSGKYTHIIKTPLHLILHCLWTVQIKLGLLYSKFKNCTFHFHKITLFCLYFVSNVTSNIVYHVCLKFKIGQIRIYFIAGLWGKKFSPVSFMFNRQKLSAYIMADLWQWTAVNIHEVGPRTRGVHNIKQG